MNRTPKGMRLHIGIFGRRNVGKSSLLNAITKQEVSIVSDVAGTTTDPVEKPMEMLPIGPVLFIDTAGIDDVGALGKQRIEKTRKVIDRIDIGILVAQGAQWGEFERRFLDELCERKIPVIVAFNKVDVAKPENTLLEYLRKEKIQYVQTVAIKGRSVLKLREALIIHVQENYLKPPPLIGDLIRPEDMVILVVPIDLEAPKGRLILPQVHALRDILDHDACAMVVKERELRGAIEGLKKPPALVVTDSQAFLKVDADTPLSIPMTSFSILLARHKGDLEQYVKGTLAIEKLKANDRILVAEACTHHPIGEDIGRIKIPRWLKKRVGGELEFIHVQGHDFPEDLSPFDMVILCGSCMVNRREVLSRIIRCGQQNVPVTNYGMCIAYTLGLFERAISVFQKDIKCLNGISDTPACYPKTPSAQ